MSKIRVTGYGFEEDEDGVETLTAHVEGLSDNPTPEEASEAMTKAFEAVKHLLPPSLRDGS